MAEYEPFPTGANEVDDRSLQRKILGCFGCGGLSVLGFFGVLVLLIGGLGISADGCEVDPGNPGEGTESLRLPVEVTPTTGLADGTVVRLTSDVFGPNAIVGVAVCLRSADTERRGVEACAEDQGARYPTTNAGVFDASYPVPRVITVGGKAYDCAAKAKRCIVVAASADDYDHSGGQPITFAAGLPAADLTPVNGRAVSDHLPIGSQPAAGESPIAAGTDLRVLASGFQPNEPLLIAYCTNDLEDDGMVDACDPENINDAISAVMARSVEGIDVRADASGAFTTTLPARSRVTPFDSGADEEPGAPDTTTTGAGSKRTTTTLPKGAVSCTEATGGCSIVIAAAADTKRSAVLPYVVTG